MTEFVQVGEPMPRHVLADLLHQLSESVRSGDSGEGFLEYLLPEPDEAPPDHVMVRARVRTGNLLGQGGMITYGKMVEKPDPS